MKLFDVIVEIAVDHPVIGGSFGCFLVALIAALLNLTGWAALFVLIGIGLAVLQIVISNR
jgi:hypothetical protein